MSILAIDYGIKKTGLAISYYGQGVKPLGVYNTNDLTNRIFEIFRKEEVEEVVIGQIDYKIAKNFNQFIKIIKNINIKFHYIDETGTTKDVIETNIVMNNKRNRRVDDLSACLILEKFLESNNYEKPVN